jgi:hypothetical protein
LNNISYIGKKLASRNSEKQSSFKTELEAAWEILRNWRYIKVAALLSE